MGRSGKVCEGRSAGWPSLVLSAAAATVLALVLVAVGVAPARAQGQPADEGATVRVVHAVADAGPVDLYVDGALAVSGITFPDATDPLRLAAGERLLQVAPTGAGPDQAIAAATVELAAGRTSAVAAVGTTAAAQIVDYPIDLDPLADERARLRVVHASPDAGELEVAVTDGDVLFPAVQYPDATDYAELDAGTYDLEVRAPGADVPALALPGTDLAAGVVHDIVVVGQTADNTLLALILTSTPAVATVDGRPAWIATGGCGAGAGDDEVASLSPVAPAAGELLGQVAAAATERSFTVVEIPLDDILAEDHAIVVAAAEAEDALVACGEIGGALTDDGNLVVGLREQNGSGLTGIALLAPSVADPATTDVSVYLAAGLAPTGGDEPAEADEPGATIAAARSTEPTEETAGAATAEATSEP